MRGLLFFSLLSILLCVCVGCNNAASTAGDTAEEKQDTMLQREILGITLGETQIDSAIAHLKRCGYGDMEQADRDIYMFYKTYFGGRIWDFMALVTYQDKVESMQFFNGVKDLESFYSEYDELSSVLKDKYNTLIAYEDTAARKRAICFLDSLTSLDLYLDNMENQLVIKLVYTDIKLKEEYNRDLYNEL